MTLDQIKESIAAWAARRKWEAEWRKQNAGRRIAGISGRRQLLTPCWFIPARRLILPNRKPLNAARFLRIHRLLGRRNRRSAADWRGRKIDSREMIEAQIINFAECIRMFEIGQQRMCEKLGRRALPKTLPLTLINGIWKWL